MVDPAAEYNPDRLLTLPQTGIQFVFADHLNNPVLFIGRKDIKIQWRLPKHLIPEVVHDDVHVEVVRQLGQHLFFTERVQPDEDTAVFVQIQQLLHVLHCHFQHLWLRWEIEFLLQKGVIDIQNVDVLGAPLKIMVKFASRVQMLIVSEYFPIKAHVSRIEYRSHIAFNEHHHASDAVIGVEKGDCHAKHGGHFNLCWRL